jgi:hypothetical protein
MDEQRKGIWVEKQVMSFLIEISSVAIQPDKSACFNFVPQQD